MATQPRRHNAYTIGWVCALPKEQTAAIAMLDERHPNLSKPTNDPNSYTLGSIFGHNIVIAYLPKGKIGTSSAATVATHMVGAFPAVRFGLIIGIGGGIPPKIRLGDIVISVPIDQYPGVIQWDMGKAEQGGVFRRTGALNNPPSLLLSALTTLESDTEMNGTRIPDYLHKIKQDWPRLISKYLRSNSLQNILFKASYGHIKEQHSDAPEGEEDVSEDDAEEDCRHCDKTQTVKRKPRDMRVHYGLIASGNQVVKDASVRDQLSKTMDKKALCIEMEAAGLMDNFPCIVIRGICDYADSHKNKSWQEHAAAVAAAFAKELLGYVQPQEVDNEETVKDVLARVSSELSATKSQVLQTRLILEKEGDLKVLNWLVSSDFGPQHSDHLRRRQPGTGQWLLDCDIYRRWVAEPGQKLFCPGIPGAGKTILLSIVIDNLESRFSTNSATVVVYVYCNFNRQEQQTLEHLMSSLLKQLARNSVALPPDLYELHEKHAEKQTRPTLEEISTALGSVITAFARIFIVVDALDECQVANNCRIRFLHQLFSLLSHRGLSIFATSRHLPDIEKEFSDSLTIEIRAHTEDIGRYLKSAISRLPRFIAERSDLQNEIMHTISQIVDGMFLLAQLYCNTLMDKDNPKVLRNALRDLATGSKSYEAAYDGAMKRIEGQLEGQAKRAKQVLVWIICAQRPLTKTELQHALAVETDETKLDKDNITQVYDLVSTCAGLITIDEASSVVRLVHYTTQKYFESTQERWFPAAHSALAETCATYLSFDAFADGRCRSDKEYEDRLQEHPFFEYAASYWGTHARAAPSYKAVPRFLQKPAHINALVQAYFTQRRWSYKGYSQNAPSRMVATHLAAMFGLGNIISAVWNGSTRDARDSNGRTPLSWAATRGHIEVVKLLLETKELNVNAKDSLGMTPLLWAATRGHTEVVTLLLETKELDIDVKDDDGMTPLSSAATLGHVKVVQLLLETKEVNTNTTTKDGETLLRWAVKNGHAEVVRLLLPETNEVGVHVAIFWAAEIGHAEVFKVFLESKRTAVDDKNIARDTPLLLAARNGHTEVVQMLLETKEVEIDVKDNGSRTPLLLAAGNGHTEVVKILLDTKEVEIDAKNKVGSTPLLLAAGNGHTEVVKILLDTQKVEIDVKDNAGRVSLFLAPMNGYAGLVESDVEYKSGRTPLLLAAKNGYTEVVKLLLETEKVDVNAKDDSYRTPVSLAAGNGHTEVVKLLLQTPEVDINAKDTDFGQTPLWWAARHGRTEVVKVLLKIKEVKVNVKDDTGRTPLLSAARYGSTEVVKLLLETNEIDVNDRDNTGETPLSLAVGYGTIEVLKLLLEIKEVDVNAKDNTGRTPLLLAVGYGTKGAIELLLNVKEVDINVKDNTGSTPLLLAVMDGHIEVVKMLLDKGADWTIANSKGWTPLHSASSKGYSNVVKLLLEKAADQDMQYVGALQTGSREGQQKTLQ